MKLKSTPSGSALPLILVRWKSRLKDATWLKAFSVVLYTAFALYIGASLIHYDLFDPVAFSKDISSVPQIAVNKTRGVLFARPDKISLDIKHKNFQRLAFKREEALLLGHLITNDEDYVVWHFAAWRCIPFRLSFDSKGT